MTYVSTLEKLFCDSSSIVIDGLEQGENETEAAYFERKLGIFRSAADEGVLLIIDNFDTDGDARLRDVLAGNYHVILTTRNAHPGYPTVRVEAMRDPQVLMRIFEEKIWPCLTKRWQDAIPGSMNRILPGLRRTS